MRCRSCDYCLWNIASRQCPECGTTFAPSAYEFRPGSVAFCCPACNQAYYGTNPLGQLQPRSFQCVSCGSQLDVDDMVLRPATGVDDAHTELEPMPWLQRRRLGFLRGWLGTIGLSMARPARLMTLTDQITRRDGQAWWFAVLTNTLYLVLGWGFIFLMPMVAGIAGATAPGGLGVQILSSLAGFGGYVLGTAAAVLLVVFLWGLTAHGVLRLTGPVHAGIRRTFEALCYASGANALTALPCMGPWIGWVWPVIAGVLTVREAQQTGGGRAALAVLAFPITLLGTIVIGYIALVVFALGAAGGMPAVRSSMEQAQLLLLHSALERYAMDHDNAWPPHALALARYGWRPPSAPPTTSDSATFLPGTEITEADLAVSTMEAIERAAKQVAAAMPEDVVAHRLGRVVFTYHGVDRPTAPRDLWMAMMLPRPPKPGEATAGRKIVVVSAGGSLFELPEATFAAEVAAQNVLRAGVGLPPLPDPATVTVSTPARASDQSPPSP